MQANVYLQTTIEPYVRIIDLQPSGVLADWWVILNHEKWPAMLGESPTNKADDREVRAFLLYEIIDRIGLKECLRAWNRPRMADTEFESWWSSVESDPYVRSKQKRNYTDHVSTSLVPD